MSQFSSPQLQKLSDAFKAEMQLPELTKPSSKLEACARHYTISPANPHAHLFEVEFHIAFPESPQTVALPNWIPGSYLIRDFSKHLIDLRAYDEAKQEIKLHAIDKSTWQFDSSGQPVTLRYQVYAWDLSVRGAHFDQSHAFYNGTSVFLQAVDQGDLPCVMSLIKSAICVKNAWKAATGMPVLENDHHGFGHYRADDYSALIDYPVEIGSYTELDFRVCGVPHKMVITGIFDCDMDRLKKDLSKICEYQIRFFGEPAPMESYLFQVTVTGSDYGGLEHRNSTALICSRNDLPYKGMGEATEGYLQFLELCSHEYFHSWNVKRILPRAYQTTDLSEPAYSRQLWWFEGVTSYYDALILLRCGVIDSKTYLNLLSKQLTRVYRMPGRFKQTVADSSFFTWTKFYQQDENAPNAIISYYTKGSLIALALDLIIRQKTGAQKSLDDVLLYLWRHYGQTATGLQEFEIEKICSQITGLELDDFFQKALDSVEDINMQALFADFGMEFILRSPLSLTDLGGESNAESNTLEVDLGVNVLENAGFSLKITHVWQDSATQVAGMTSGDELIAINGLKMTSKTQLENMLKRAQQGDVWRCTYFRRDELYECELVLKEAIPDRVEIRENKKSTQPPLCWLTNKQQPLLITSDEESN